MAVERCSVVLTTAASPEAADRLASELVARRLAACVNVLPGVRSHYRWRGEVCRDDEVLLVCKTRTDRFEAIRRAIVELHDYDTPEVVRLDVADGDPRYLAWVLDETGSESS